MGAWNGSRPDDQFEGGARRSGQRDDRRPQRDGDGREQSVQHPDQAVDRGGLRLARVRKGHDRRALGRRRGRHFPAAGVLSHVLPAGQCRPRRCRQVRPGRDARLDRESVRCHPQADSNASAALYRRARAGRRAQRFPAPRRRHPVDRGPLPHRSRRPSGRHRAQRARQDHDHRTGRPSVHGAGRRQKGDRRAELHARIARPWLCRVLCATAAFGFACPRARNDGSHARRRAQEADHAGGSRPRPRKGATRFRREDRRPGPHGNCAVGIGCARRLASRLHRA